MIRLVRLIQSDLQWKGRLHSYMWVGWDGMGRMDITDMEFVQKFTPLDFQVKNFTPSILPNFNSFSAKKAQKMSENGEIYTAGKNFTLPPALTAWTNSTSASHICVCF